MADWIPRSDAAFDEWLRGFTDFVILHGAALGISPQQITALINLLQAWQTAYHAHLQAQHEAKGAMQAKNEERDDAEAMARQIGRIMQASPNITDQLRAQGGMTVPDTAPTPQSAETVQTTHAPLVRLDWSQRQRVLVHAGQNPADEHHNPLPDGMRGIKLWYAIGGIPQHETDWRFLVDCTRSPYVHVFTIDTPATVAYRAQYFDRKMRPGPFGDPVICTVSV